MNRETWKVGAHAVRPAGKPTECFYCHAPVGADHNDGCVIRSRTVVVRFEVELVIAVPEEWDASMVDFRFQESSWCANNFADLIKTRVARSVNEGGTCPCLCGQLSGEFVREATAEDETNDGVFVAEVAS